MVRESREKILAKMYRLIRKNPGIRPRELHHRLGRAHSASLRDALIERKLVRKKRRGVAVHYYTLRKSL